jgi:predicted O-methyltransferase YrrM
MASHRLTTWLRYGALAATELAGRALRLLDRQARALEVRLDGVDTLAVSPGTNIPFPSVDLAQIEDPVPLILADPLFQQTDQFFSHDPASSRSLVSAHSQALLYTLVRNLKPDHIVEIGVYKAATSEALARALRANGRGTLHAVDPFRTEYIRAILQRWPSELAAHVEFHPTTSVEFFSNLGKSDIRPSLVLVDGNHDYEFAHFDIVSAARYLTLGGFILADNVAQPGPFLAVRDFLSKHPGWQECGGSTADYDRSKAYDSGRSVIPHTDLIVLRAPAQQHVGQRPWSPGVQLHPSGRVEGVRLKLHRAAGPGLLLVQVVLRGFGETPREIASSGRVEITSPALEIIVPVEPPLALAGRFSHFTAEPWLVWEGDAALVLAQEPTVF